jgi:glycosyltransferase involved in cell wall biosynthesis
MSIAASVIVPTHNPHTGRLASALAGLKEQSLPSRQWELVVVDNNSDIPVAPDLSWHPSARVIRENHLGLTKARLAGGAATVGELLVFVDDDNVLDRDYLKNAVELYAADAKLGAAGGKSLPEWESPPASWVDEFSGNLALRDLGDQPRLAEQMDPGYPDCAPVGAGMVVRRMAWAAYSNAITNDHDALLDRTGGQLTSGGDNDIILRLLRAGWRVGYFPQLSLKHLIPAGRVTREYLARLNYGIAKSWVQVLARHDIRPWPPVAKWTVPLRKLRSYLRNRAWAGPAEYVRWKGACGQFEGRSLIG